MTSSDSSVSDSVSYLSPTDQKQIILVGRWMGLASMLGSTYIILLIAGSSVDRETKLAKSNFYRFLLLLSIFDVISSLGYFLSTIMIPQTPPPGMEEAIPSNVFDWDTAFPWAFGNKATCTVQGIMIHIGMTGSILFTGFISLHYVFAVRYKFTSVQMRRMEIICYFVGIIIPAGGAIFLALAGFFNPYLTGFCWINQYPIICDPFDYELDETGSIEAYCTDFPQDQLISVEQADTALLIFAYPLIGIVFIVVVVSMVMLYHSIQSQEQQQLMSNSSTQQQQTTAEAAGGEGQQRQQRRRRSSIKGPAGKITKKTIQKAMLLIFNYIVMYVPVIIASGIYTKAGSLVNIICLSSQGVLNAFVYSGMAELLCLELPSKLCKNLRAKLDSKNNDIEKKNRRRRRSSVNDDIDIDDKADDKLTSSPNDEFKTAEMMTASFAEDAEEEEPSA